MGISKAAMKRKGIHLKTVTVKKTAEELIFSSQHHVNTKPVTFNYSNRNHQIPNTGGMGDHHFLLLYTPYK